MKGFDMTWITQCRPVQQFLRLSCLTVLAALAGSAWAAPPEDDPFADSNSAAAHRENKPLKQEQSRQDTGEDDPFADLNRAKPAAREDRAPPAKASTRKDPTEGLIRFDVSVTPPEARPGQTVRLTIKGTPKEGYHTYP